MPSITVAADGSVLCGYTDFLPHVRASLDTALRCYFASHAKQGVNVEDVLAKTIVEGVPEKLRREYDPNTRNNFFAKERAQNRIQLTEDGYTASPFSSPLFFSPSPSTGYLSTNLPSPPLSPSSISPPLFTQLNSTENNETNVTNLADTSHCLSHEMPSSNNNSILPTEEHISKQSNSSVSELNPTSTSHSISSPSQLSSSRFSSHFHPASSSLSNSYTSKSSHHPPLLSHLPVVRIVPSTDGSGVGVGIIAAVQTMIREEQERKTKS